MYIGEMSRTSGSSNPIKAISSIGVVSGVLKVNVLPKATGETPKYRLNAFEKDCAVSYPIFSESSCKDKSRVCRYITALSILWRVMYAESVSCRWDLKSRWK